MPEKRNSASPEANHLRAKRRNATVARLRVKAANGETDGSERGLIRLGASNTRILTGQDDLSDWDDEELRKGTRRDKNGKWQGKAPIVVPKALHDELIRRTMLHANEIMQDNLEEAVRELVHIATSEACEAKDRLRAISMIMDRVMGKPADKVEISGQSPWLVALQGGIVTMNGNGVVEEDDVDEAEWEDDEPDG